jgi:threonine 3-dehydrogenase
MTQGRKIAMLGLPAENFGIGWAHLATNMITIKGTYRRQMFKTWYEMSVLVHSGLDISPDITHRFDAADSGAGLRQHARRPCSKVSSPGRTGKQ